jgi:hypothetical protein
MVQITVQIIEVIITGQMFILMQFLSCGLFTTSQDQGSKLKTGRPMVSFGFHITCKKKKKIGGLIGQIIFVDVFLHVNETAVQPHPQPKTLNKKTVQHNVDDHILTKQCFPRVHR